MGCTVRHVGSYFPNKRSNPRPLQRKHGAREQDWQGSPYPESTLNARKELLLVSWRCQTILTSLFALGSSCLTLAGP